MTTAVSLKTFKITLSVAGKSADIRCQCKNPNAAQVKFDMRQSIKLAGLKSLLMSCNFLLCNFHLAVQIKKFCIVACNIL